MNPRRVLVTAGLAALLLLGAASASAAPGSGYTLDWYTVDGGGGSSAGGSYALSATAGQPDACALHGGAYTLNGGFWASSASALYLYLPTLTR